VRLPSRLLLAAVAGCVLTGIAHPAFADVGPVNPPGSGAHHGVGTGTQSGSGGQYHAQVKTCSLYANSSGFGMSCFSGGSSGSAGKKVAKILAGHPAPCWDVAVSASDLAREYGITDASPTDAPYYVHQCITGLNLDAPLSAQPTAQIDKQVIEIPNGVPTPCDLGKDKKKAYTADMIGSCKVRFEDLTPGQQAIASAIDGGDTEIPGITLVTHPSPKVRTNVKVTYADPASNENPVKVVKTVDGVKMWAEMTEYKIYPYGPNGSDVRSCKVNTDGRVGADDDSSMTDPPCPNPALRWTYLTSSAAQPDQAYPFRAETHWSVFYIDAGGNVQRMGSFTKSDDVPVPVYDIQTLVVGG
jgi:hypothetical protein